MSYGVNIKEIKKVKVRNHAKKDLFYFAKWVLGYELEKFHREWTNALQNEKRILLLAPRGSYKSTIVSVAYPLWLLVNDPNYRILIRSGTDSLARSFLREIKGHIEHNKEFRNLFGIWKKDAKHWKETSIIVRRDKQMKEVSIACAGINSDVVSQHYDVIINDDIVTAKNVNKSDQREKVDRTFKEDFGLLIENGQNIVVGTRWRPNDLYGTLLEDEEYKTILFMAHKKDGSLLFPDVLSEEFLKSQRNRMGSMLYLAQYENDPKSFKGAMFSREWFEIVEQAPADLNKIRYWDLAATEQSDKSKDPDWTVGALVGEKDGIYYILNIQRMRGTPLRVEELIKQTALIDLSIPIYMEQEGGASGKGEIDHYRRVVLKGFDFHEDKKASSKVIRARPVSAAAEAGNVKLLKGLWNKDFLEEIELFPNGEHDDQVDGVSGAFEKLGPVEEEKKILFDAMSLIDIDF